MCYMVILLLVIMLLKDLILLYKFVYTEGQQNYVLNEASKPGTFSELCQTFKIERFTKIVNTF